MADKDDKQAAKPDLDAEEMDRRMRIERRKGERRKKNEQVAKERRAQNDRRGTERRAKRSMNQYDLEADSLEFIRAINRFKERSGRPFPTWSEVLTIVRELGYEKPE